MRRISREGSEVKNMVLRSIPVARNALLAVGALLAPRPLDRRLTAGAQEAGLAGLILLRFWELFHRFAPVMRAAPATSDDFSWKLSVPQGLRLARRGRITCLPRKTCRGMQQPKDGSPQMQAVRVR